MRDRTRSGRSLAVVVVLMVVAACSATTTGGGTTSSEAVTTSEGVTTTSTAPTTSTTEAEIVGPETAGNAAWLGGFGCGASALDAAGSWYRFREEVGTLGTDQVMDIVVGGDGVAWIATSLGVERVAGGVVTEVSPRSLDAMALDPVSGDLWGVAYQRAARYDGVSWEEYPSTDFGEGDSVDLVKDVAVDRTGHPWVATTSTVATWDGVGWTWWGSGAGFPDSQYPYFLESIAAAPDGRIWVSTTTSVLVYDGESWTEMDPGVSQAKRVSVADDGRVFVASYNDGFATYEDGSWQVTEPSAGGLTAGRVRAVEADAEGRLWVGTTWGLSVLAGGEWTTYTMATSGMAGNCVDALAIHGAGPAVIPAPTEPVTGSLVGTIVANGAPLTGIAVVLCSDQPGMLFSGDTPCSGYPFETVVTTDAEGGFAFSDVPVGDYDLAWQVDADTWRSYLFGGEVPRVRPGETTRLETIESETD